MKSTPPAGGSSKPSEEDSAEKGKSPSSSSSSSSSGFTLGRPQAAKGRIPEAGVPLSPEDHVCLLDCISLDLQEMDIFSAERLPCEPWDSVGKRPDTDLFFTSYSVRRSGSSLLQERCHLRLKVERNLDRELSHAVPDMSIHGSLSSVHCSLDLERYQLIRGLLDNNLGEPVEEFLRPYNLQDPSNYTVLSGDVYTSLSFLVDMMNVSLELLDSPKSTGHKQSLARFDFMKSKLLFESFSNGSKSVNLVSHSLLAYDTRYSGSTGSSSTSDGKHNVFDCILQPSRTGSNRASLQLELHYRSTRDSSCFTVVLNNLRVLLIFDWLQLVRDFLRMPVEKGTAPPRQRWPSGGSDSSTGGAVMPKTVKSGVVTKRSTVPVTQDRYLEVKLNVTGTEFVVVEDSSCLDTNAIILKGTTVLTYKPRFLDRPFSGSLAGIEVFSCRLGSEQETALSIIDPVNIQMELCGSPTYQSSSGLLDAFNIEDFPPLLEIQFPALDIRLSYNDVLLFLAIAKSLPSAGSSGPSDPAAASQPGTSTASTDTPTKPKDLFRLKTEVLLEGQLMRLQDLGFRKEDCKRALVQCKGQLDQSATWLLENAESTLGRARADSDPSSHSAPPLSGIEVKAESVCICFIDDCLDCDVPLAEFTFSRLYMLQRIGSTQEGNASFTLSGDYYNRELSGWEPFIEPWPCFLTWHQQAAGRLHPPRLKLGVRAKQRLDVNITSVLLEQYSTTKTNWLADYCKEEDVCAAQSLASVSWMGSSVDPPSFGQTDVKLSKRRQPFVPYALRNHTGCTMCFATLTTTPTRVALSHSGSVDSISEVQGPGTDDMHNVSQWREVLPGEEIPFEFEAREKLRHRHTHELKLHQLLVRVGGWEQVKPVSVDKVGVFFRYANPDRNNPSNTVGSPISRTNIIHPHVYFSALPPVRVVFSITMEGSARKVITVQSALMVKNRLEVPMEVRLDSPSAPDKPVVLPPILPGQAMAIPLHLTSWRLQARPKGLGLFFCKVPIHWTSVERPGEVSSSKRECQSADFDDHLKRNFRFCVVIKKENYPDQKPAKTVAGGAKQIYRQPGHTIYLLPTLVLANLLPCDLNYYIKGTTIKGTMKPGKEAVLHAADTSQNMELGVLLENFPMCKELLIPPGTSNYVVRMRLYDANHRLLCLTIRIILRAQGALKILISSPYWLINKTGLPLIFRQDNTKTDASGQFEEHEMARSLSPLLFGYTDKEQPNMCTMRIGKGIHPEGVPGWCQGFSLDGGSGVRAVKVIQHSLRPGLIYNIGINVRKGKGRYRDTHIVTFAPRYLLDNRSSHKLAFSQREFARGKGTANPEGYISTPPGSSVVFHWPRNDYDQLLCVRLMDNANCTWSGGFEVNKPKSFHVNMRDTLGKCFFLRAEISLKGATYQISFSDTDHLPPPFRIDNISDVPIQFWQHGVVDIRLHTEVKAGSELDYACDEPTLPPYLTLTVKGAGSSEVTADMNFFREYNKLYYENFIYIAATYTFSQDAGTRPVGKKRVLRCAELVLDVEPKTQRVILKKKEPGKRSQLWRMTGTGMLCHEGSSPPQSKPAQPRPLDSSLVLDIAGLAAVTDNSYEPLMLRRPDSRRSTTQTWHFSSGMLTCGLPRLVVQVKGSVSGLFDGAEVVLGPDSGLLSPAPEQQFINQKMRPGSGVLSVQVVPDGPTRVLQISDFNHRRMNRPSSTEENEIKEATEKKAPEEELEVLVNLEDGVGVSLVNKVPEELVFATLSGIDVHFTRTAGSQVLEMSVQKIQVDNQLLGTTQPVMLCVTPASGESSIVDSGPALQVNAVKVPSNLMLTDLFKHLMVTARRFTVIIEEKLLLKLLTFFGYGQTEELEKLDENLYEKSSEDTGTPKRYYFENLKISLPQVKLSVFTSHKLPPDLKALKGTLGIPLIRFEDAIINMYPYTRVHPYETQEIIINDILKHFREELISQAAQILGSVDFLGNPMGLLNDVTEGVSELIKYGNVGGLIRNVTHGVSNSAAKFAGTLSDGLGKTMDHRHQSEREYIRYHGATSGEHLVAGIHGLAHGIIGGLTSVITSTVEGVKTEGGVSGFFSGLGKGLVGTVTKPVAGALDFASETAQTVRDMASLSNHRLGVQRVRKPRCCKGPQGLLPRFSTTQADGQEQLFQLTDNIHSEFFIAVEPIDSYCVLISSKVVYFLKPGEFVDREAIFLEVKYDDLYHCLVSRDHGKVYVQLTKKAESTGSGVAIPGPSQQKPMVHVKSENLAVKISQEVNYAKSLYYEQQLMLPPSENEDSLLLDS
ncbi:vacuolar protein sorting-associated protein 13D isoform X2 [Clupea harengus]|uniref:Vacuolar protein sorting-associated protein 13D isoform X2 n=1 Tax=Clupea harengus TaxID=7950 RepID=A0A6P8F1W7_CLUHA|nr:vacuolar protein sorting-associated protein 13D isoform X2 [Clupea harengus]